MDEVDVVEKFITVLTTLGGRVFEVSSVAGITDILKENFKAALGVSQIGKATQQMIVSTFQGLLLLEGELHFFRE